VQRSSDRLAALADHIGAGWLANLAEHRHGRHFEAVMRRLIARV
jgi:hypothetical protein